MASEDCNICFHKLVARRELPCRHTICLTCVQKMVDAAGKSDHLSCPLCRCLFSIANVPTDRVDQAQYVREKYKKEIKSVRNVGAIQNHEKIMGMTVLGDALFIVCKSPSNVIFKYDIDVNSKKPPVELCISDMKWPRGIAASETFSCLYITDWHTMFDGQLWRYKYQKGEEHRRENPVAILKVQPFGVSVSEKTDHILVTCATPANVFVKRGWIYIYKPSEPNFERIRKIELPDLEIPRHAILTSSSKFIVCHGWLGGSHGVTSYLEDERGQARKNLFYGKVSGGGSQLYEMNRPLSMTQDEAGLILVVDHYNHRIQLLTEDLQLVRHLVTSGITYPRHVCQHAKSGRMYVSQEDGQVQIFDALMVEE